MLTNNKQFWKNNQIIFNNKVLISSKFMPREKDVLTPVDNGLAASFLL